MLIANVTDSTIEQAFFSTEECFCSVIVSVREKNATGRFAWFRVAAIAVSEASVSTTRGIFSSTECNKAFSISSLKFSNVFIDSESRDNELAVIKGLILSENLGIYWK